MQMSSSSWNQLFSASGSQYAFGAILHGLCYKSANALAHLFGSFGNQLPGRTVHISHDPMWEAFARPAALTTVAFLRHELILNVSMWNWPNGLSAHHVSTRFARPTSPWVLLLTPWSALFVTAKAMSRTFFSPYSAGNQPICPSHVNVINMGCVSSILVSSAGEASDV